MSMGEQESYHNPEPLQSPSERLLNYLQGQFVDAWRKEVSEDGRGEEASHGSFIQRVPIEIQQKGWREEPGRSLTRGSYRVVMKMPHPHDRRGDFYEVFAIGLNADGEIDESEDGVQTRVFLVRRHLWGRAGKFVLVDSFGIRDFPGSFDKELSLSDLPKCQDRASDILVHLEKRNIVAVKE